MKTVLMFASLAVAVVVIYRAKQAALIGGEVEAEFEAHPIMTEAEA